MPPVATKEFLFNSFENDDQFRTVESSSEMKEIKPFSSQPSESRDQMLLSHVVTSNCPSSKSFGSKHSVFSPVKSSLNMSNSPQSVSVRSAIHSREHVEQFPNQHITIEKPDGKELYASRDNDFNSEDIFKPVISAHKEEIKFKHENEQIKSNYRLKNRQRPPFQFIDIYPEDEDIVSQLSFDGEYDSEYCNDDKEMKEVLFSRALIDQTDQIIKRAKELTLNREDNNLSEDHIQPPQKQFDPSNQSRIQGIYQDKALVDQDRQDIVTQDYGEMSKRDEKDSHEKLPLEHENVSLSCSIKTEESKLKKSNSPPLQEIFIPMDAASFVYIPKETRSKRNYRSKEIDDRINKIKNRGRLRYKEKSDNNVIRIKAACY